MHKLKLPTEESGEAASVKLPTIHRSREYIQNTIAVPKLGSMIKVSPLYFYNAELFFCFLITPTSRADLQALNYKLNEKLEINNFKPFHDPFLLPKLCSLVLARYSDGNWYRAKILSYYQEQKEFKIFYCDYGNFELVKIDRLRQWAPKFDYLPFQAICCQLHNAIQDPRTLRQSIRFFQSNVEYKEFNALVRNNKDILVLDIVLGNGETLTNTLYEKGLINLQHLETEC